MKRYRKYAMGAGTIVLFGIAGAALASAVVALLVYEIAWAVLQPLSVLIHLILGSR